MQQTQQTPSIDELRAQVSRMLDGLDPNTPIAATVVFKVDKTKESTFIRNADVLTAATRKLPGLKVFVYHKHIPLPAEQDSPDTLEYLIYEDWESRDLFRTQWNSKHLTHFQYTVGNLIVAPPDLRFYYGWDGHRGERQVTESDERSAIRELTKNAFSFSWSLSLFGVQQLANVLKLPKATGAFGNVSRTMERELDGVLRRAFEAGDTLQRGIVDGTLGGASRSTTRAEQLDKKGCRKNAEGDAATVRAQNHGMGQYALPCYNSQLDSQTKR